MRVALVPRSAEIQPTFWRFVTFTHLTYTFFQLNSLLIRIRIETISVSLFVLFSIELFYWFTLYFLLLWNLLFIKNENLLTPILVRGEWACPAPLKPPTVAVTRQSIPTQTPYKYKQTYPHSHSNRHSAPFQSVSRLWCSFLAPPPFYRRQSVRVEQGTEWVCSQLSSRVVHLGVHSRERKDGQRGG